MKPASRIGAEPAEERAVRASLTGGQDFLARVAHELRGPAGVTLGALDELEREGGGNVENQQRLLLGMARRGALKILRTADRLSRISQLESGTLTLSLAPTDLAELTRRAFTDARAIEPRKGVTAQIDVPSEPMLSQLDEGWAHTAVLELIWSALRTARESLRVEMTSAHTIQISNDAPAWAQGASRRQDSHAHKDSALSISLADEIVKLHGGSVRMVMEDSSARAIVSFAR